MNESYPMPEMPNGVKEGIIKGMYKFKASSKKSKLKANLFGSGTILNEAIKAGEILEKKFNIAADIWSVTSYKELRNDGLNIERYNLLNPDKPKKIPYVTQKLKNEKGVFVSASDYVKAVPDSVAKWFPKKLYTLGTDGFGRSETRECLRDFFEVDAKHIVLAALTALADEKKITKVRLTKAIKELKINQKKKNPMHS